MTNLGDNRRGGQPAQQDSFVHRFAESRAAAAAMTSKAGEEALARELEALWLGDTWRSCVVFLGQMGLYDAAITGHQLATIKRSSKPPCPAPKAWPAVPWSPASKASGRPKPIAAPSTTDRPDSKLRRANIRNGRR